MTHPIDPVQFQQRLDQQPFQPLRVVLTDGRNYDVQTRQHLVICSEGFLVGIQATGEPLGVCEYVVTIPFGEIRSVESLAAGDAAKGRSVTNE